MSVTLVRVLNGSTLSSIHTGETFSRAVLSGASGINPESTIYIDVNLIESDEYIQARLFAGMNILRKRGWIEFAHKRINFIDGLFFFLSSLVTHTHETSKLLSVALLSPFLLKNAYNNTLSSNPYADSKGDFKTLLLDLSVGDLRFVPAEARYAISIDLHNTPLMINISRKTQLVECIHRNMKEEILRIIFVSNSREYKNSETKSYQISLGDSILSYLPRGPNSITNRARNLALTTSDFDVKHESIHTVQCLRSVQNPIDVVIMDILWKRTPVYTQAEADIYIETFDTSFMDEDADATRTKEEKEKRESNAIVERLGRMSSSSFSDLSRPFWPFFMPINS